MLYSRYILFWAIPRAGLDPYYEVQKQQDNYLGTRVLLIFEAVC